MITAGIIAVFRFFKPQYIFSFSYFFFRHNHISFSLSLISEKIIVIFWYLVFFFKKKKASTMLIDRKSNYFKNICKITWYILTVSYLWSCIYIIVSPITDRYFSFNPCLWMVLKTSFWDVFNVIFIFYTKYVFWSMVCMVVKFKAKKKKKKNLWLF